MPGTTTNGAMPTAPQSWPGWWAWPIERGIARPLWGRVYPGHRRWDCRRCAGRTSAGRRKAGPTVCIGGLRRCAANPPYDFPPRSSMHVLTRLSPEIRQYLVVTGNYWAFTLTDGALRMLVVLHFHGLGYSPLQIAALFLFYEIFGVVTNLVGGWLGARLGLNRTMNIGLGLQVAALLMLTVPAAMLSVPWVMAAQALSGIAKDLNKMSAKSSIKLLVPDSQQGTLYQWVAVLTGSKNALKGVGFFLGGLLLTLLGFTGAVLAMAAVLALVWLASLVLLKKDLGKAKSKPRFRDLLSKSRAINILSAARLFLFGARDVWFVVALPVFLA